MSGISFTLDTKDLAEKYEVASDHQTTQGHKLLKAMGVGPGHHILDIGAGTGRLAKYAADLVGPSGKVIGVDPLPKRILIAQDKAAPNLSFKVADGQDLAAAGFKDNEFDMVYMNAVFHWIPDKQKALCEAARVLKPGGKIGIASSSGDKAMPWREIKEHVFEAPDLRDEDVDVNTGMPTFPMKAEYEEMLKKAGFKLMVMDENEDDMVMQDPDAFLDFIEASSFGNLFGHLSKEKQVVAKERMVVELEKMRQPEGIHLPLVWLLVIAEKA